MSYCQHRWGLVQIVPEKKLFLFTAAVRADKTKMIVNEESSGFVNTQDAESFQKLYFIQLCS